MKVVREHERQVPPTECQENSLNRVAQPACEETNATEYRKVWGRCFAVSKVTASPKEWLTELSQ
jgi:hypothetical protein